MRTKATSTTRFALKPPTTAIESEDWNPVFNPAGPTVQLDASDNDEAEDRNDKERLVEEGGKESSLPSGA